METTNFTFVTTTNAPGLSRQAAKLMRGHVTRINFTKRRERKARRHQARTEEIEPRQSRDEAAVKTKGPSDKSVNRQMSLAFPLAFPTTTSDPCYEEKLLSRFRSLAYLDHENYPRNPSEVSWFSLFISEPALAEVSMGICERLWSPDALCRWRSESHWNTAFNIVIERIQAKRAHTDGVLAAVVNMAFGERLVGNEATWNVHIDGVAQIIRDRHARGIFGVPPWLERLLVFDSLNEIFGFPRVYHKKILAALGSHGGSTLFDIGSIIDRIVQWRKAIYSHSKHRLSLRSMNTKELDEESVRLYAEARALRTKRNDPYVQAASRAIDLVIGLSWLQSQNSLDPTLLAGELKEWLDQLQIRPCIYMDLTSCHFMIGAIATDKDRLLRDWFVMKMRRVVLAMRMRGWGGKLKNFERGFISDASLRPILKALWEEVSREE